jgi:hypothetical protein
MNGKLVMLKCDDPDRDEVWIPVKNILLVQVNEFKTSRFLVWYKGASGKTESVTCDESDAYRAMEFIK